jgi:hypothetical protein
MVILLLCGGSSGDVVHATGPYNNTPPSPRVAKRPRRRKDRHVWGPPVSSVLVQSKGSDSGTHDTTTLCRTESEDGGGEEEELESLTFGSRHEGSSVSPLPPIVEDEASSDGSLTEEDDEDLQLLLIPKAVDRNDYLHGAPPSASSLLPVMELLVRTVLDDPTAPLSKSSCFDAVLKCGKDRAEIHRLRQQIRELQQQQKQLKLSTNAAPVGEGTMYYEVRDLSALRSKRNGKMEAELRLRQSLLRCWSPSSLSSKDDDEEEEAEEQKSQLPNDMLHSDYSCIIPLDTKKNAVTVPSGKRASTPPNHNPATKTHFPSSGSESSTLPTTASSETSEASVGPDASVATDVRIDETTKPIDDQDASAHVSVRLFI